LFFCNEQEGFLRLRQRFCR